MSTKPEKRHKCHFCSAVRIESKMRKLEPCETKAVSQFNNDQKCWGCNNEYACNEKQHPQKTHEFGIL